MTGSVAVVAPKAIWYLTRGTGIVSLLLLTAVVVMGIANSLRWAPRRTPRFVVQNLHRNVSLLSIAFIAIHVATAVIDGFAPIRWLDAVVPFSSAYRPVWLGLGAVAFDVLLAVAVTSLVRARLGHRAWRAVHWTAYASWIVAVMHGLGTGSDTRQTWLLALVGACVIAVVAAAAWRVAAGWPSWGFARSAMASAGALVPLILVAWVAMGPLRPGWAQRSGTPQKLLVAARAPVQAPLAQPPVASITLPAQASFRGRARTSAPAADGLVTLRVSARTHGSPTLSMVIALHGTQEVGGGMAVRSGSVVLTPPEGAAPYRGSVTALSGGALTAALGDGHGDLIDVSVNVSISPTGAAAGQMAIQAAAPGQGAA